MAADGQAVAAAAVRARRTDGWGGLAGWVWFGWGWERPSPTSDNLGWVAEGGASSRKSSRADGPAGCSKGWNRRAGEDRCGEVGKWK